MIPPTRSFWVVGVVITITALALVISLSLLFQAQMKQNRDIAQVAVELCNRAAAVSTQERQVAAALVTLGRATAIIAKPETPPETERKEDFLSEIVRFNRIVRRIEPLPTPEDCSLESILEGGPIIEDNE